MTDKKRIGRPPKGETAKKSFNVYLEPKVKDEIIEFDGSLTASLERRHKQITKNKKK